MKKTLIISNILFASSNVLGMNPIDRSDDSNRQNLALISVNNQQRTETANTEKDRKDSSESNRDKKMQEEFSELHEAITNCNFEKIRSIIFKHSIESRIIDFAVDYRIKKEKILKKDPV